MYSMKLNGQIVCHYKFNVCWSQSFVFLGNSFSLHFEIYLKFAFCALAFGVWLPLFPYYLSFLWNIFNISSILLENLFSFQEKQIRVLHALHTVRFRLQVSHFTIFTIWTLSSSIVGIHRLPFVHSAVAPFPFQPKKTFRHRVQSVYLQMLCEKRIYDFEI